MSEGTYAPKSPDLSSFYDPGPTSTRTQIGAQVSQPPQAFSHQSPSQFSPHQLLHLQPTHSTPYFPDAPRSTYQPQPLPQPHSHLQQSHHQQPASPHSLAHYQAATDALGYSTRSPSTAARQQYYSPIESFPQQQPQALGYAIQDPLTTSPYFHTYGGGHYQQQQHQHPHQLQPPQPAPPQSHQRVPHPVSGQLQPYRPQLQQKEHQNQKVDCSSKPPSAAQTTGDASPPSQSNTMPPRRAAAQPPPPPAIDPSPVRTKFPTARIKRIMQADEEVGKVAQQTPIAVGKALELFMVQLVTKSADVAREKNSKRVSAQMLKQVVESDDQWDFLREIVSRVETEEKAGKSSRAKAESESDDEMVEKKKARPGRKKKA